MSQHTPVNKDGLVKTYNELAEEHSELLAALKTAQDKGLSESYRMNIIAKAIAKAEGR